MTTRPHPLGDDADVLGPDDVVRVVTLDGPAGSGKSTVARAVARALGLAYVDSGATYRAVTLAVLRAGVALDDVDRVREVALAADVALVTDADAPRVLLDGEDVTAEVRGPEVTAAVSAVSAVPEVRARLVQVQRRAMVVGSVAEGRDVGTAVAPSAVVKVFLDADPQVRAARRAGDADAGVRSTGPDLVGAVAADLARRDALDSGRAASPTRAADDAVHLDSSALSVDEVVARVLALAAAAGLAPSS
ncbi:MAG: cmk [Frankiales bacterium]|nr:cmk [Frankiales bacterium]